jgi:RNA polymerase sigma-70 factor, ECF subfamily
VEAVPDRPDASLLALYDRALPQVYGYLASRCGDQVVAEDLTSETFLAAAGGSDVPLTVAWLIGIARHKLVDHWRWQARQGRLLEAASPPRRSHVHQRRKGAPNEHGDTYSPPQRFPPR